MNPVDTQLQDGIFTIKLSRPKQFNALNWDMLNGLNEAVQFIEGSSEVRCVVIEGEGDNFMAGGDIVYFHDLIDTEADEKRKIFSELISTVHQLVERLANLPVPVIAKVRGAAAGFGISLVAGCDLAIGTKNSFYTSAYNLLGTSPDGGSTFYMPRSVGMKKAMEIALLTKRYSANEALEIGLVSSVVAKEDLVESAVAFADHLTVGAPLAVKGIKELTYGSLEWPPSVFDGHKTSMLQATSNSEDAQEGVDSFLQKRPPQWRGK